MGNDTTMQSFQREGVSLRPWRLDTIGRFRVIRRLSSSPFSDTLLVLDGDRQRILRWLSPWVSDDVTFFKYFVDMSSSFVEFEHPNVVHIHEHGEAAGRLYVLTERLPAVTLVKIAAGGATPFPLAAVLCIMRDLLRGLDFVHHAMSVDGKPLHLVYRHVIAGRVLITDDGHAMLREPGPGHADWQRSRDYQVIHQDSVRNLSPEDMQRQELDARGDLYSLACLMLDLCVAEGENPRLTYPTGERKLLATHEDTLHALSLVSAPHNQLKPILGTALHVERAKRYGNAATMYRALDPLVANGVIDQGRAWLAARAGAWRNEQKWLTEAPRRPAFDATSHHPSGEGARTPIPENLPRVSDPGADTETVDIPMRYVLGEFGRGARRRGETGLWNVTDKGDEDISLDAPPPDAVLRGRTRRETPEPQKPRAEIADAIAANEGARSSVRPRHATAQFLPDPRIQSVASVIKEIASSASASAVTRAAQQRLSGTPEDALATLDDLAEEGEPRIRIAAELERGLSYVETQRSDEAIATLRHSIEELDDRGDISLCRYYLVLAYLQAQRGSEAASMARVLLDDPNVRFPGLEDLYAEALRIMGRSRTSGR